MRRMRIGPARRPIPRMEPGAPAMPEGMSDNGKREWFSLLPVLLDGNLVTPGDGMALAEMCELQARSAELRPLIDAVKSASSREWSRLLNKDLRIAGKLLRLWDHFGMSPLARARIAKHGR
jgi:phage terminase small subunit